MQDLWHLHACAVIEAWLLFQSINRTSGSAQLLAGQKVQPITEAPASLCTDCSSEWILSWKLQQEQPKLSPHQQHLQALSPPLLLIWHRYKLCHYSTDACCGVNSPLSKYCHTTGMPSTYCIRSANTSPFYYGTKLKSQTEFPPLILSKVL